MKYRSLWFTTALGLLACGTDDGTVSASSSASAATVGSADAGAAPASSGGAQSGGTQGGVGGTGALTGSVGGSTTQGGGGQDGVCEVQNVDSGRVSPDMLIVLDRSGSMRMGNVNRWDPSVSALKQITASLGSSINFGLMAFPGQSTGTMPMQDCSSLTNLVDQIACFAAGGIATVDTCVAGSVDVPIAPNNGMAIATALDNMAPNGATPTAVTLKAAHDALGSVVQSPDEVGRPKYVLLVTDGAPNCSDLSGGGGRGGLDAQAVDQSVAEIMSMAQDGIKTYVIGYNTKSDADLSAALDRMAQAGNTGDVQHRAIEDEQSLLAQFEQIAGVATSCELVLQAAPDDPSFVDVRIDGAQIFLNDANGWTISDDRRTISLQGTACTTLSGSDRHVVSVQVLCNPVLLQ